MPPRAKNMAGWWTSMTHPEKETQTETDMMDGWSMTPPLSIGAGGAGGAGGGVIVDITDDSFLQPQTWEFPEIGEEELQEIIRKLEDRFLQPQTREFPEVGEEDLQEIIRKLEAGDWRLKELKSKIAPITQIKPKSTASKKKAQCDISMENCPPSTVSSESDLASSASALSY